MTDYRNKLDPFSTATAHYVGWKAASRLLQDDTWLEWLSGRSDQEPAAKPIGTDYEFDQAADREHKREQTIAAARAMTRAFVHAIDRLSDGQINSATLAGTLVAACSDTYLSWNGDQLEPVGLAEARDNGVLTIVVGDIAEGTLHAVQSVIEVDETECADTASLFTSWFSEGLAADRDTSDIKSAAQTLADLEDELGLPGERGPEALARSAEAPWLWKEPRDAWNEDFADALLDLVGDSAARQRLHDHDWHCSASDLLEEPEDDPDEQSGSDDDSAANTTRDRKDYGEWLNDTLKREQFASVGEPEVVFEQAPETETFFKGAKGWPKLRFLAAERLRSLDAHADVVGRKDFSKLAPVPDLGVKRDSKPKLGPPLLDVLWAVRTLQETFPGRVGGSSDAPLRIKKVSLALVKPEEESRAPHPENRWTVFERGAHGFERRTFGKELLQQYSEGRDSAEIAQFFVCFELHSPDEGQTSEVSYAFPWRFGDRRLQRQRQVKQAMRRDAARFTRVEADLRSILRSVSGDDHRTKIFEEAAGELCDKLNLLQEHWNEFAEQKRENFGEEAGVHTRLAPDGDHEPWAAARNFTESYHEAVAGFVRVFAQSGDLASRIAAGPLEDFLDFGLAPVDASDDDDSEEDDQGADRIRAFGYHPLRLARLARIERQAWDELQETILSESSLREVPISTIPSMDDIPAVVWPPTEKDEAKSHLAGQRPQRFYTPAPDLEGRRDFWSHDYTPHASSESREPDLIQPLHNLIRSWSRSVFPGMQRRMSLQLHPTSLTDHGIEPLRLCADLVGHTDRGTVTEGIDLTVGKPPADTSAPSQIQRELEVPANAQGVERLARQQDVIQPVQAAMSSHREDDPRFALEVFSQTVHAEGDQEPSFHANLLVRPWESHADWVVRDGTRGTKTPKTMVWDHQSASWDAREAPADTDALVDPEGARGAFVRQLDDPLDADTLEQRFQELIIRRWRGEADALPKVLGQSVEASPEKPLGNAMKKALADATSNSLRTIVIDGVFGAEAVDLLNESAGEEPTFEVAYADDAGDGFPWRVTVLRKHALNAEEHALQRGLEALATDSELNAVEDTDLFALADQLYEATHRAIPGAMRHIWNLAAGSDPDGELIGHLGVALATSCQRDPMSLGADDTAAYPWLVQPFPPGTILLSIDKLQRWMWTRRSGTRGDFLAVIPDPTTENVRLVAIEAKGSAGDNLHLSGGTRQAAVTRRKLRERFAEKDDAEAERRALLQHIARAAFRARANHRLAYDRIAEGNGDNLHFDAVCISTAANHTGDEAPLQLEVHSVDAGESTDTNVPWLKVHGLAGLRHLAGLAAPAQTASRTTDDHETKQPTPEKAT